jgi:hypothetical protein
MFCGYGAPQRARSRNDMPMHASVNHSDYCREKGAPGCARSTRCRGGIALQDGCGEHASVRQPQSALRPLIEGGTQNGVAHITSKPETTYGLADGLAAAASMIDEPPARMLERLGIRGSRLYLLALLVTLAAAAVSRLSRLDLMEFKGDEAVACRLALHVLGYSEPGVGRFFPTAGLVSSIGIPNPPLFVYLVAIPLVIVPSPIAAAIFIAAANVVAVWLTFIVGTRYFSRFVGLAAAAMLAVSPWSIVFSRKIWAQDLLPVCTTLFALQVHSLLVKRRPRAGFLLIVIAAAASQLHFSGWILFGVAAVAIFIARRWISWRWVGGGVAVAVISYLPFIIFNAASIIRSATVHHSPHASPSILTRFEHCVGFMLDLTGGGGMASLLGRSFSLATLMSLVLGVAAILGLAAIARRRSADARRLGFVLVVWYLLPLVALTVLPVHPYIHYFIVLLPLPFLGVAYLLELASRRRTVVRFGALLAIVGCLVVVDVRAFRTVVRDGGAPGDYGIAYKYKRDAISFMLRHTPSGRVRIGFDIDLKHVRALRTYRFLLWDATLGRPAPRGTSPGRFVLVSRFSGAPPLLAALPRAARYPRSSFGPLTVVAVPPTAAHLAVNP